MEGGYTETTVTSGKTRSHVFNTDNEAKVRPLRDRKWSGLPEDTRVYSAVFRVGQFNIDYECMWQMDEAARVSEPWSHASDWYLLTNNQDHASADKIWTSGSRE